MYVNKYLTCSMRNTVYISVILFSLLLFFINPTIATITILSIDHNYDEYSRGAKEYYRSVDLISIVKNILNS